MIRELHRRFKVSIPIWPYVSEFLSSILNLKMIHQFNILFSDFKSGPGH